MRYAKGLKPLLVAGLLALPAPGHAQGLSFSLGLGASFSVWDGYGLGLGYSRYVPGSVFWDTPHFDPYYDAYRAYDYCWDNWWDPYCYSRSRHYYSYPRYSSWGLNFSLGFGFGWGHYYDPWWGCCGSRYGWPSRWAYAGWYDYGWYNYGWYNPGY